jgi:hypothetical protein
MNMKKNLLLGRADRHTDNSQCLKNTMLRNITQGSRVGQILCGDVQNCDSSASGRAAERASCERTNKHHASQNLSAVLTLFESLPFLMWDYCSRISIQKNSHMAEEVKMAITTVQVLRMVIFHIIYTRL